MKFYLTINTAGAAKALAQAAFPAATSLGWYWIAPSSTQERNMSARRNFIKAAVGTFAGALAKAKGNAAHTYGYAALS